MPESQALPHPRPAPAEEASWEKRFGRRFKEAWQQHGIGPKFYTNLSSFLRTEIAQAEKRGEVRALEELLDAQLRSGETIDDWTDTYIYDRLAHLKAKTDMSK